MSPTSRTTDPRRQARDLRLALEGLAEALATGHEAAVLACEPRLADALDARALAAPLGVDERAALTDDLLAARAALARCRAVGEAHALITGVTLDTLGRATSYSRHGAGAPRGPRGRDLHARV